MPEGTEIQHAPSFFLKIAEIKGSARSRTHDGETELMSWSWGETQTVFPSEARKSGGNVSMRDFEFKAATSAASSQFLLHCAAAKRFKSAVITCEQDGPKGRHTYLTITLSNVVIGSYEIEATPSMSVPTERVTLKFTKIEFTFVPLEGGNFSCSWDLALGAA
jgi:type VI protein secretion system component Hcp